MRHLYLYIILITCYWLPFACNAQIITTVAGNGTGGFSGDGGQATNAELNYPEGVTFDAFGNLYIADGANNRIRKINTAGIMSTFAGYTNTNSFSGDGGQATSAGLYQPTDIAFDVADNMYVADTDNHRIRIINTSGIINTYAGTGTAGYSGDGGQATNAEIYDPNGLAFDAVGNLYISDYGNNRIRMVNTLGVINTFAGNGFGAPGIGGYSGDGGQATDAELNVMSDIAIDATGNVYIADFYNQRIRMVNTLGIISTFVGNGTAGYSGDGGQATNAELNYPNGVTCDTRGNLYIADYANSRIRMVNTAGIITTIVGNGIQGFSGDGGQTTAAELYEPLKVAFDATGNLYIADGNNNRIRKVTNIGQMGLQQITGSSVQVAVYPNPTSGILNVECLMLSETTAITITDMLGNAIYHSTFTTQHNTVNVSDLNAGIYLLRVETNEGTAIKKIIKN